MPRLIYRFVLNYHMYYCGKAEEKSTFSTHFQGGAIAIEKTCIWIMWSFCLENTDNLLHIHCHFSNELYETCWSC